MLWILVGVVLAGIGPGFHDSVHSSTRRDGRSLGEMVKTEMGEVAGLIALFGTFMIMIIILAVLALIVVKALTNSPWGMFTVVSTIPIAVLDGRPGCALRAARADRRRVAGRVRAPDRRHRARRGGGGEPDPGRCCSPSPARSSPGS